MRNGKNYIPGMYTCDTTEVKDMCLHCTKPKCPGDCAARREAAGLRAPKEKQYIARESLNMERLSPREREFLALYDMGMIDRECAERMGVAESSAWSIRAKLGLPALGRRGGAHNRENRQEAFA